MMRLLFLLLACGATASAQTTISACGFTAQTDGTPGNPHIYILTQDITSSQLGECIILGGRQHIVLDGNFHTITHADRGVGIGGLKFSTIRNIHFVAAPLQTGAISNAAIWKNSGTTDSLTIENNIFEANLPVQSIRYTAILLGQNHQGDNIVRDNVFKFIAQGNQTMDGLVTATPEVGTTWLATDNLLFLDGQVASQNERHRSFLIPTRTDTVAVVARNKFQFSSPATKDIWGGNTEAVSAFCTDSRVTGFNAGTQGGKGTLFGRVDATVRNQFYFDNEIISYTPSRLMVMAGCDGATVYRNKIWFRGNSCVPLVRPRDAVTKAQIYENYFDFSGTSSMIACEAIGLDANSTQPGSRDHRVFDNVVVGASTTGGLVKMDQNSQDNFVFNNSVHNLAGNARGFTIRTNSVATRVVSATILDPGSGFTNPPLLFSETFADGGGVELEAEIIGGSISAVNILRIGHGFDWLCPSGDQDRSCGVVQTPRVITQGDGSCTGGCTFPGGMPDIGAGSCVFPCVQLAVADEPNTALMKGVNDNAFEYNALTGPGPVQVGEFNSNSARAEGEHLYTPTSFCASTANGSAWTDADITKTGTDAPPPIIGEYPTAGNCECETIMPATPKRFFNETTGLPDVGPNITCGPTVGARVDLGSPVAPDVPALVDAAIANFGGGGPPVGRRRVRGNARLSGGVRVQ